MVFFEIPIAFAMWSIVTLLKPMVKKSSRVFSKIKSFNFNFLESKYKKETYKTQIVSKVSLVGT